MLVRLDRALDATLARRTTAACAEGPANVRMSRCEVGIATIASATPARGRGGRRGITSYDGMPAHCSRRLLHSLRK